MSDKQNMTQCRALVSWGDVWTAGRKRCTRMTGHESGLCGIHRAQEERRAAARKKWDDDQEAKNEERK